MNEWGVFQTIVAVLGLVGTFYAMFYKPMHELNVTIKVLIANFENSQEKDVVRDQRLNNHSAKIDKLHEGHIDHESRIKIIENSNFIKKYEN